MYKSKKLPLHYTMESNREGYKSENVYSPLPPPGGRSCKWKGLTFPCPWSNIRAQLDSLEVTPFGTCAPCRRNITSFCDSSKKANLIWMFSVFPVARRVMLCWWLSKASICAWRTPLYWKLQVYFYFSLCQYIFPIISWTRNVETCSRLGRT